MYHYLTFFRDAAREVFHGTVVGAVIDNSMHLKNFLDCGKKIIELTGMEADSKLSATWAEYTETYTAQI